MQQTSRNKKFATQHCVFGRTSLWAPPGGDYTYDTDNTDNTYYTYRMYNLMSVRHGVFASNPLIWLGFNYRARQLGSKGGYSNSAIAASSSLAVNSTPRRLLLIDSASLKYSNSVRPADAFDAADADESLSTFNRACFTSLLRDAACGSCGSIGSLLCAVFTFCFARTFCPLDIPLLQYAAMQAASSNAAQCQMAALLATMLCNGITQSAINAPSFDCMLCHCGSPRRITRAACFHIF